MNKEKELLMAILDCGETDLEMLDDIKYDLYEIIKHMKENEQELTLNNLIRNVFLQGASDLQYAFNNNKENIREKINEKISDGVDEKDCTYEEYKNYFDELDLLYEVSPMEDLGYYINGIDSHVYMKHLDFYRRYLPDEVDNIEYNMGWQFEEEQKG